MPLDRLGLSETLVVSMTTAATTRWRYKARTAQGKVVKGLADAHDANAVRRRLASHNLIPIEVTSAERGLAKEVSFRRGRVKRTHVAQMTRQLASMKSSGLSLSRSLDLIAGQGISPAMSESLREVRRSVDQGRPMSVSMSRYPKVFPPVLVAMVQAGEESGRLDETLDLAAKSLETDANLRGKIRSAMTYPIVVSAVGLLLIAALVTFIVPVFSDMYSQFGGDLPLPTQILLTVSGSMPVIAAVGLVAGLLFGAWYRKNRREAWVREKRDALLLRLPVFGGLVRKASAARLSRSLAALQSSGVPLAAALPIAGATSGLYQIEELCARARRSVISGLGIWEAFASGAKVLPPMLMHMLEVGEQSAALESLLPKAADYFEKEAELTAEKLTSLLEPALIVVLGGMVLAVLIAVYLPVLNVSGLVSG